MLRLHLAQDDPVPVRLGHRFRRLQHEERRFLQ